LNIAYLFHSDLPSPDAVTDQVVKTIDALAQRKISIRLVVPYRTHPITWEQISNYSKILNKFQVINYKDSRRLGPLRDIGNAIRALRIPLSDHIFYTRNLPMLTAGMLAGYQCVFETYRPFTDTFPFLKPYFRTLMGQKNFIGAILHSQYTKNRYEKLGIQSEKLLLAYNGYDPKQFESPLEPQEAREQLGLPKEKKIVVYTGRISEEKGLNEVLSIASLLPETLFVLVGSKSNGEMERRAEKFQNINIITWQTLNKIITFLYAADVLLIPPCSTPLSQHRKTVLPMKTFTYLAAGRAILGPETPDVTEILKNEKNAILVKPNDTTAAANALSSLLNNQNQRRQLSQNALNTVAKYTWNERAKKIHDFLLHRISSLQQN